MTLIYLYEYLSFNPTDYRYYRNHFKDTYRQAVIDLVQGHIQSEDLWNEINHLELLSNVASSLVPVGPPQYMTDIAIGPEKLLASAMISLSRSEYLIYLPASFQ